MLFDLEGRPLLLHLHAQDDVQVLGLGQCFLVEASILRVISVLDKSSGVMPIRFIDTGLHEDGVHVHVVMAHDEHFFGVVDDVDDRVGVGTELNRGTIL